MFATRVPFLFSVLLAVLPPSASAAVAPFSSFGKLPGGNGHLVFAFHQDDVRDGVSVARLSQVWDHPYALLTPEAEPSRDLCREVLLAVSTEDGALFAESPQDLQSLAWLPGTGIVAAVYDLGDLRLTQYLFAPLEYEGSVLILLAKVENLSGRDLDSPRLFATFDLELGGVAGDGSRTAQERARFDADTGVILEQGMTESTSVAVMPLSPLRNVALSPEDPKDSILTGQEFQGGVDSGVREDVRTGMSFSLEDGQELPQGGSAWVALALLVGEGAWWEEGIAAFQAHADSFSSPEAWLEGELAAWDRFHAYEPVFPRMTEEAQAVLTQQTALLKMAQVREAGGPFGQIPASSITAAPVGEGTHVWNITWPRDAAYATVALARSCHREEARASMDFFLNGAVGDYQDWVGGPYAISVCRYHGDGSEESDWNDNGPNVEFDDFGLFLWAFAEVAEREEDSDFAASRYLTVKEGVADVLLALQDDLGLIAPDSSIWETHWYGHQKHYTWTSLWASAGLTRFAAVADSLGQSEDAETFREGALGIAAAIAEHLVDPVEGILAGNREELPGGPSTYMDAAVVEAFNQNVLPFDDTLAHATLDAFGAWLRTPSGNGYFRNDDGDLYDQHEWVVMDLRIARALHRADRKDESTALLDWVVGQARLNFDLLPELYHPETGAYAGPAPMNGFGAGALWVTYSDSFDLETELPCPEVDEITDDSGDLPEDPEEEGCSGCRMDSRSPSSSMGTLLGLLLLLGGRGGRWLQRTKVATVLIGCVVLAGCQDDEEGDCPPPIVAGTSVFSMDPDTTASFSLVQFSVSGEPRNLDYQATSSPRIDARVDGELLVLTPTPGWTGTDLVEVTASNACGEATVELWVTVAETRHRTCGTTLRYSPPSPPGSVYVAGTFNNWDPLATPLTRLAGGSYDAVLDLEEGAHPYKFVVYPEASGGGAPSWTCDPEEGLRHCDAGYTWEASCGLGLSGCNSLMRVEDCTSPRLVLESVAGDREEGEFTVTVRAVDGAGQAGLDSTSLTVTLAGQEEVSPVLDEETGKIQVSRSGLSPGKHTLRLGLSDGEGRPAVPLFLPLWTGPAWDWRSASLYYAFVDRMPNGNPNNDSTYGASWPAEYHGGDYAGVKQSLPDLAELGVTALWISPPQDNPEGAFPGTCSESYTGYHGYWPANPYAPEDHFGTPEELRDLIGDAHDRGIRVLADFVGNHVHEDHPYYSEHLADGWFTDPWICGENDGWNLAPETCWFDSFLPDINYYHPDPLDQMVEDALYWVKEYDLDGFRIDAVKHMPHSFHANLRHRLKQEVEHQGQENGGLLDEFYLVGETFTGDWGLIASYVSDQELTGQFDFPLYYAILQAFARNEIDLYSFSDTAVSLKDYWGLDGRMSNFLGNHDVDRFISQAAGQVGNLWGSNLCADDGEGWPDSAQVVTDPVAYNRLILAFTFLFTWEGIPLLYYGDEVGLPGFHDPDNRQDLPSEDTLTSDQLRVKQAVTALGQGRKQHPSFWKGNRNTWWEASEQWCYSRVYGDDAVLVCLNRSGSEVTLTNGLAWAQLPLSGAYQDLYTQQTVSPEGDSLTMTIPAQGARVWVHIP